MDPSVAIIGAGPTGLCAAIELKRRGITPTIFEARNCLGGQWAYEIVQEPPLDVRDDSKHTVYSAMYPKLWTNLPKYAMQMSDYPLPEDLKLFPGRVEILDYIDATAKTAGITPLIHFNTPVNKVVKSTRGWQIQTQDMRQSYSHVIVASGKDSYPFIPEIKGMHSFKGILTHSQSYRFPDLFKGQRVVLIGASVSAEDISIDISPEAERVYVSGSFPQNGHKCYFRDGLYGEGDNVSQHARPERIEGRTVVLQDGEVLEDIDAIILCTGYLYRFPFLEGELHDIGLSGMTMGPLFLNMFYPADPTLIFMGLPRFTVHFAAVHLQSVYCAQIIRGERGLPSVEQIAEYIKEGCCILEKSPASLSEYHAGVFKCLMQLSELSGTPFMNWNEFLEELNDHKRTFKQNYRDHPFEFDLKVHSPRT